jgi:predicted PurR-regulated permease PerM
VTTARPVDPQFHIPGRRILGLLVLVAIVLWFARPVILPFVVAALIAYAFTPFVDAAVARSRLPRVAVVVIGVAIGVVAIAIVVLAFAGPVSRELELLFRAGPDAIVTALRQILGSDSITIGDRTITVEELATRLQEAMSAFFQTPEGALRIAEQVLHSVLDIALAIIVTFYLLLDGQRFANTALRFLEPMDRAQMVTVAGRIHRVLGQWLRGQLVLVVFVAAIVAVVLGPILGLPYATALGVMTGALEIIPLIGPLIAGLIVAIVALGAGGLPLAITCVVFLFILRQVEDIVIAPIVVGRSVNLHPLVTLFAVVVGTTAFGVLGTFLAVPVAAAVNVALHEFFPAELGPMPGDPGPTEPASDAPANSTPASVGEG